MAQLEQTPITLLEAANVLLNAIGVSSIMSFSATDTNEDADDALAKLSEAARFILTDEWHFNTETEYPIAPDTDGFIQIPSNFENVVLDPKSFTLEAAQRGRRLYDLRGHTFVFTSTVYIEAKVLLPFEDFPEAIRWYVTAMAGKAFGSIKRPTSTTFRFTSEVEAKARERALQYDSKSRSRSLLETNETLSRRRRISR